jgi:hypothetical protein
MTPRGPGASLLVTALPLVTARITPLSSRADPARPRRSSQISTSTQGARAVTRAPGSGTADVPGCLGPRHRLEGHAGQRLLLGSCLSHGTRRRRAVPRAWEPEMGEDPMSCIRPEDPLPLRGRGRRFDPPTPGGGEGQGEGAPRLPRHPLTRASVTRPCPAAFVTPPCRRSHMSGTRQTLPDRPYRIADGLDNLCVDRTARARSVS